jgi:hypothetical protein
MMLGWLRLRLRALLYKREVENELDEELHCHLEQEIEQHIKQGMPSEEARYTALRNFGAPLKFRVLALGNGMTVLISSPLSFCQASLRWKG